MRVKGEINRPAADNVTTMPGREKNRNNSRFQNGALVGLAGCLFFLWPTLTLWPCEQTIRPGTTLKLAQNWRFRTGNNSPGNKEVDLDDSRWQKISLPAQFGDNPATKKYQGYVWYRCVIILDESFFVREPLKKGEQVEPTDTATPPATPDAESTKPDATKPGEAVQPGAAAAGQPGPAQPGAVPAGPAGAPPIGPGQQPSPAPGTAPQGAGAQKPPVQPPAPPPVPGPNQPGRGAPDPRAGTEQGTISGPGPQSGVAPNRPGAPTGPAGPNQGAGPVKVEPGTAAPGTPGAPGTEGTAETAEPEAAQDPDLGPPHLKGMGDLALYLGIVGDADTAYFNGAHIGQTGVPDQEKPAYDIEKQRLYSIPHHLWRPGKNVVSILVYGTVVTSGFQRAPEIVVEQPMARSLFRSQATAIVFSYLYILVAAFFALFAVFFRDQREHMFFSLFSLILGVYNLLRTNMRYILFEDFTFETTYQMELILLMLLPICFLNFLTHLLGLKTNRSLQIYYGAYALLILAAFFVRAPVGWAALVNLNLLMVAIALGTAGFLIYKHYAEQREKLKYVVYGMAPLAAGVAYDMFVTLLSLPWVRVTVYAFLIFLGFVALQLSGSILQLFHRMREQEEDLMGLEKRKTRSIFNISREFSVILEGIYNGLEQLENHAPVEVKSGGRKSDRGKKPNIDRSIRNLESLVNDSRLMLLLEANDYAERSVNFSLRNVCQEVIERAVVATGEPKKRLFVYLPEDDAQISGDPDLISTALYHLVENALYYSTGRIEVYAEREYSALKFTVRDEGPGMSAEQQRIIFQKFIRGSDDAEIPGIGIGLPIVNLIAHRLRGDLRLESGAGFFSTFIFQIPLPPDQRAA